jgi:16S rRNA (guanine966-N2)-methyltransferase
VEDNRRVVGTLKENVRILCQGGAPTEIRQLDALFYVKKGWTGDPFDIILADPPYDHVSHRGWLGQLLLALRENGMLTGGGLLVFEQGASENVPVQSGWNLLRDRKYGDTRLLIFRCATRPEEKEQ